MNSYSVLGKQIFQLGKYSLVPIRMEDRHAIRKWRNEQIYHLRQEKPLTEEDQDKYFTEVVQSLFDQDQPKQLLFSFLEGDVCIGYGGLVHINWIDKNAEISFIMNTSLEADFFEYYWENYLSLIELIGFGQLHLRKLYVYAFDIRPHLYSPLERADYFLDAILKDHCLFQGTFRNVVIYSKIKSNS